MFTVIRTRRTDWFVLLLFIRVSRRALSNREFSEKNNVVACVSRGHSDLSFTDLTSSLLLFRNLTKNVSASARCCDSLDLLPSFRMDEDKKFDCKDELHNWLTSRGVDEDKATKAAGILYAEGYDMPSTLLISRHKSLKANRPPFE